jgi:hypothetical protein
MERGQCLSGLNRVSAMLPAADKLVICFAHVAYQLHERFSALATGISSFPARSAETLQERVGEADVSAQDRNDTRLAKLK